MLEARKSNHDGSKFVRAEESAGSHDLLSIVKLLEEVVDREVEGDQRGRSSPMFIKVRS